jgi:peptide/nickel transport system substrate-binding protein
VPTYSFDLAKAKAERAKSAYPNGFNISTDTISYGTFVNIRQVIASELKQIGINLKVNVVDFPAWVAELYGPKTYTNVFTTVGCPNPDPSWYPSFLLGSKNARSGAGNLSNYDPPAVDALIKEGTPTVSKSKRLAIYAQLEQRLNTDEPMVTLYGTNTAVALGKGFSWPTYNALYTDQPWELQLRRP